MEGVAGSSLAEGFAANALPEARFLRHLAGSGSSSPSLAGGLWERSGNNGAAAGPLTCAWSAAQERSGRAREWMSTNSWIVNDAVILFFLVMTLT